MIVQSWPLFYPAVAGLYLEAPEAGDQTPPNRAEPATWMWTVPMFQGQSTVYTEEPEAGDKTFENRAEPQTWMWRVLPILAQDSLGDLFQATVDTSGDWAFESQPLPMWRTPLYLGESTLYTEQPEAGDQTPLPRHEPEIWMWRVPYFLGESTVYTEDPEAGDFYPHPLEPNLWMWRAPFFQGGATEYTEEPEQGDFYPHPLEPNLWMWREPFFQGGATEYAEEPEQGDFYPHPGVEPNFWMWTVPYHLGDSTLYTEQPEVENDGWRIEPASILVWPPYPTLWEFGAAAELLEDVAAPAAAPAQVLLYIGSQRRRFTGTRHNT